MLLTLLLHMFGKAQALTTICSWKTLHLYVRTATLIHSSQSSSFCSYSWEALCHPATTRVTSHLSERYFSFYHVVGHLNCHNTLSLCCKYMQFYLGLHDYCLLLKVPITAFSFSMGQTAKIFEPLIIYTQIQRVKRSQVEKFKSLPLITCNA